MKTHQRTTSSRERIGQNLCSHRVWGDCECKLDSQRWGSGQSRRPAVEDVLKIAAPNPIWVSHPNRTPSGTELPDSSYLSAYRSRVGVEPWTTGNLDVPTNRSWRVGSDAGDVFGPEVPASPGRLKPAALSERDERLPFPPPSWWGSAATRPGFPSARYARPGLVLSALPADLSPWRRKWQAWSGTAAVTVPPVGRPRRFSAVGALPPVGRPRRFSVYQICKC